MTRFLLLTLIFFFHGLFSRAVASEAPIRPEMNGAFMLIVEHPKDATVCVGGTAHFSVKVSGDDNPKFQWQTSVDGNYWNDVEGAHVSVYEGLRNLTKTYDGLKIRVVVRLDKNEELISQVATLTVDGQLACTVQPESQLVAEGGTLELSADFSSKGNVRYQWQYCPYGTLAWLNLSGEVLPKLKIPNVQFDQSGGQFRLIAWSTAGCDSSVTNPAFMEVIAKPLVQLNRGQSTYCGGGSTTFTVKMRGGSGKEKVQWQESRDSGKSFRDIPDANGLSYTIDRIVETMAGYKYRAFVTLPGSIELVTPDITITVHGVVAFNEQPLSQTVCPGDAFSIKAKTDFKGSEPEYAWQESLDGINFIDLAGGKNGELKLISNFEDRRTKYYRAIVNAGPCQTMLSDIAKVQFLSIDAIEPHLVSPHIANGQTEASITHDFNGDPNIFSITWQWSANDGATWQTMNSTNPESLTLRNISKETEGSNLYRIKILNTLCARIYYSESAKIVFEQTR